MSPVDRAGSLGFRDLVSPLFSLQKFRCVHMTYQKAGWPGYRSRDLGFCDQDLGNRAGNFSHMNIPADTGTVHVRP